MDESCGCHSSDRIQRTGRLTALPSFSLRLIVKRYGDDAMHEAAERADQLLDEGDMAGAEVWPPQGRSEHYSSGNLGAGGS